MPLAAGRRAATFALCMRALRHADRWNMVEVFTIGVLLSLVRLAGLADASPGPGLYALGALTFPLAFVFFIFEVGLVATLQAFIFSTLSAIYIGGATSASH